MKDWLKNVQLDVTTDCNLNCVHCYRGVGKKKVPSQLRGKISVEDAFKTFDILTSAGVSSISISGGEPFLHPKLRSILKYAISKGLKISILTNGTLCPSWMKEFGAALAIQVSLDGAFPLTHDDFRGCPKSFERAIMSIRKLKSMNIPVGINCTINKSNLTELDGIVALAQKLEVYFSARRIIPSSYQSSKAEKLLLDKEEYMRALIQCHESSTIRKAEMHSHDPLQLLVDEKLRDFLIRKYSDVLDFGAWGGCSAGIDGVFISLNGDVWPCSAIPEKVGNIFQDDITEIWLGSSLLNALRQRNHLKGKCGYCKYRSICGGCRAYSYGMNNDVFGEDPLCWLV